MKELYYSEKEIEKIVQEQMSECWEIWNERIYEGKEFSLLCGFHDILTKEPEKDHNCIGCNFSDSTNLIWNQLHNSQEATDFHYAYNMLIMSFYLLVERMDTILSMIELNKTYRKRHFKSLFTIRKWANFIKHPKSYILCHHPFVSFVDSPKNPKLVKKASVKINQSFIEKYYSNENNDSKLYDTLKKKENVLVIYPNPIALTNSLCDEALHFMDLIDKNTVYKEILQDESSFYDFWIDQSDDNNV